MTIDPLHAKSVRHNKSVPDPSKKKWQFNYKDMKINKNPFVTPNNKSCINKICRLENWGLFAYVISRKRRASERKKLRDNVFQLKWRSHAKIQLIWSKKQKQPKLSSPFSTSVFSCKMLLSSKTLTLLCITNMPTMLYAACPEKWSF